MKTKAKSSKGFFGATKSEMARMKNETIRDFKLKKYAKKGKRVY